MTARLSGERPWRRSLYTSPVANPAAGADWTATVPGGHVWQLLAVRARLTTSAAVANRQPDLILTDGALEIARVPPVAVQAAGGARVYTWADVDFGLQLGSTALGPLPAIRLASAWSVGTATALIDAADQWDQVRLLLVDTMIQGGALDLADVPDSLVEVLTIPGA